MRRRSVLLVAPGVALGVMLLLASLALAATFTLSGRVTDQTSTGLVGATVEALEPGTITVATSTTTGTNGAYSLSLDAGTYDVRVTPPSGSGFQVTTVPNFSISADRTLDIALVPGAAVTLSGRLLDGQGAGIANKSIVLQPGGGGSGQQGITDAQGGYSFQVAPGSYSISTNNNNSDPAVAAPRAWNFNSGTFTVTTDTTLDLPLPVKRVSVRVQDPAGNGVGGVALRTSNPFHTGLAIGALTASGRSSYGDGMLTTTNAAGDTTLWLFPTNPGDPYTLTATPPSGSPFAATSVTNVTFTADISQVFALQFVHAPPVTTATFNPPAVNGVYASSPVTVTLSATAASGFTVAKTTYKLDGGLEQTYTAPFTISGDGDHSLVVQSTDNAGVFEIPRTLNVKIQANRPPTASAGGPYSVTAGGTVTLNGSGSDPDGDTLTYAWDLDNNGSFETPGQSATFSAAGLTAGTSKTVVLRVCDTKTACATAQATVNVVGALAITTESLTSGTVGQTYSATLQASGGTTPYTWSIPTGTLPAGLTLNTTTGIISGTPSAAATASLNASVADSGGQTASKTLLLTIDPASNPMPTISSLSPSSTQSGGPAFTLTVNGNGFVQTSKVHWNGAERPTTYGSATQLTAQIAAADIAAVGTPKVTVVSPAPGGGTSNEVTFTVTQGNRPPTANAGGPYNVPAGASIQLSGLGSDPDGDAITFAWDLDNNGSFETPGQSPTFSAAGLTAGTTKAVVLQVCDSHNLCTNSAPATINVVSTLQITTTSPLPSGTVGQSYSVTFQATGGQQPYRWSVASGSLPPGLGLDENTGVISGTPTNGGTYGFTIRVTDSSQVAATKQFTLSPPPTNGSSGTPYPPTPVQPQPPAPGDGSPPPACTNYTLAPGSDPLPSGMSLDPTTGVLSGTPTNGGTFRIVVQCTYNTNQTATADFTITINNPVPAITTLDPTGAPAGGPAFSLTVNGTGFVPDSKVHWNGGARTTTYVSPTRLTAAIPATDIAAAGEATVTVINPQPGSGPSNGVKFPITQTNRQPTAGAGGPYSGAEGGAISLKGTATDPDSDTLSILWTVTAGSGTDAGAACQVTNGTTLAPTVTCNDDGSYTATLKAHDGKTDPVTSDAPITVTNVAPTITAVSGQANAVRGVPVTFTGSATDPSLLDTAAGFGWQWTVDGGTYSPFGAPKANTFKATFASCGTHTVGAKAKDDDDGISDPFTTTVVRAFDLAFDQPLEEGVNNVVQKGRVVPVKIAIGCGATALTGLSPAIALVKGDVSPGTETAADEVTAYSSSAADTTGVMRASGGGYMYNLQVPDDVTVKSGDRFTIRVRPFGDSNAEAAKYIVLVIK